MHTFQPYPTDLLDFNPWQKISDEWFAITTECDGKANAMTASWGTVGSLWGKKIVTVFIRESRYTKELLDKTDTFSCCFFDPTDKHSKSTLKFLASVSGRQEDKLAEWHLDINHVNDIAFIDQACFAILCKKMAKVELDESTFIDPSILPEWYKDGDFHTMYVGEIVEVLAR